MVRGMRRTKMASDDPSWLSESRKNQLALKCREVVKWESAGACGIPPKIVAEAREN